MTYIDPTLNMSRKQVEDMINKVRQDNNQRYQISKDCKKVCRLFSKKG